jgi:aminoglycoside 2''-phosphotransferase
VAFDIPEPDDRAIHAAIAKPFPQLAETTIESLGYGWAFWAYRIGDTVFRFPRDAEFTQTLAVEAAVMRELVPRLPLPVAAINVHENGPNSLPFTSHRLIPGVPVSDLRLPLAHDTGAILGRFFRAMHAFPVARAVELGLANPTPIERREAWKSFFKERIAALILPLLSEDVAVAVRNIVTTFIDTPSSFDWQPVLSHADIDEHNLLADPRTGELSGVIDWGDIRIGDPTGEFTSVLYGALGDAGLRDQLPALITAYGMTASELDAMRPRCRFYEFCWPLYDILYGLDSHSDTRVQRGIESLREAIGLHGR